MIRLLLPVSRAIWGPPPAGRSIEFLASRSSAAFSSDGSSCATAIIIPKTVETIARNMQRDDDQQQPELLDLGPVAAAAAALALHVGSRAVVAGARASTRA